MLPETLPLRRIDHLRFFVGNARQSAYFYRNAFGFDVVAYAGLETRVKHEAGYVQGRRIVDEASLLEVGWGLQKRLDAQAVLVTRGPQGMSLFERGGRYTYLPTVAREVYDVTGAGDTVVSAVTLALAAGADYPSACHLSNHAAGRVIREVGTATCTVAEIRASLDGKG